MKNLLCRIQPRANIPNPYPACISWIGIRKFVSSWEKFFQNENYIK